MDHDAESDDGDMEEADFVTASGTSELVPISLLREESIQNEEPAFQDSMLLLAYSLTSALVAGHIGQGRSPSNTFLTHLKGKHFAYYHKMCCMYMYL